MNKKIVYPMLLIASIFFVWCYTYCFDEKLNINGDNCTYIMLARNLSKGLGYSTITQQGIEPTSVFPPGYPFFLSLFIRCGLDTLVFFKAVNGFLLFLSLLLLSYVVGKSIKQGYLVFSVFILCMMSPRLQEFASMAMSEMLFCFCCMLTLFSLYKYAEKEKERKDGGKYHLSLWFFVAIISSVYAFHTRTIGLAILPSVIVFFLFRREWKTSIIATIVMGLLLSPWQIRNRLYGFSSRYLQETMYVNPWRPEEGTIDSFSGILRKVMDCLDEVFVKGFKSVLFPFISVEDGEQSGLLAILFSLILLAVILYGMWNFKKVRWFMIAFLLGNLGILSLWHSGNGTRYLTPLIPLLYFSFYAGLYFIVLKVSKNRIREHSPFMLLTLLLIFVMFPPLEQRHKEAHYPLNPAYKNYYTIAKEMNRRLPKGTVVCCRKPELFSYYAPKLIACKYVFDVDTEKVLEGLRKSNVEYVILEQLGYSSTIRYLLSPWIRFYLGL